MLDTHMTGMLRDDTLDSLEGMPMNLDINNQEDEARNKYVARKNSSVSKIKNIPMQENLNTNIAGPSNLLNAGGPGPFSGGFSSQPALVDGNVLPDFAKGKNWSQWIVEQLRDLLHILTSDGRILYVSPSSQHLIGYLQTELVGKFIVDFIHPDDSAVFVQEFNESIVTGIPLHFFYRFRKKDGAYKIFESNGHPHPASEGATLGTSNAPGICQGFFMTARPYPTKNASLLDSFLEHKIEHERLTKRINVLKKEEEEDAEDMQRFLQEKTEHSTVAKSEDDLAASALSSKLNPNVLAMPPPAKPTTVSSSSARPNAEVTNPGSISDIKKDRLGRYDGVGHTDVIEMFTGLRYQEGERSIRISTGDANPIVVKRDTGNTASVDRDARPNEKKKKIKIPDEYVCTDCGKFVP